MNTVYMKHNPFTIETFVKINGTPTELPEALANQRLQAFVADLLPALAEVTGANDFRLEFHGRRLDMEDLAEQVELYKARHKCHVELVFYEGREVETQENELRNLFSDLQQGPFPELRGREMREAFEKALNSEFEIAVLATMSSGKSTLINAMLGLEMMPVKNMACTATISRIRDCDIEAGEYRARALDTNENVIEDWAHVGPDEIADYNAREDVSTIEIEGDIHNISSEYMRLVLVDTPGPNNALNKLHREDTIRFIKSEMKPMVLYIINGTQFGINDDSMLLDTVAQSMKGKDKQLSDRILFAVNRLDNFNPAKEDIPYILEQTRLYLEEKGIRNPNVFPLSALIAKLARMQQKGMDIGMEEFEMLKFQKVIGKYPQMNFMQYAPLSRTAQEELDILFEGAGDDPDAKLLFHSGLPSIEVAINEYLHKYAVPAKFYAAMQTFRRILDDKEIEGKLQSRLHANQKEREELDQAITDIESILERGKDAARFEEAINSLQIDRSTLKELRRRIPKLISSIIDMFLGHNEISFEEARSIIEDARRRISYFESEIKLELETAFVHGVLGEAQDLLRGYAAYLRELFDTNTHLDVDLQADLLKSFTINLPEAANLVTDSTRRFKETQYAYIRRSLLNPKIVLDGAYREEVVGHKEVRRIDVNLLIDNFTSPVKQNFYKNIEITEKRLESAIEALKEEFMAKQEQFRSLLLDKITQMRRFTKDQESLAKEIDRSRDQQEWLANIQQRLQNILDV
ncbi:MAG: dynamin family protein [Candidatus Cloacimonetes bacterium]|nr:dynamin family protein [Candidatus Cloacimonadota bacterium]